MPRVSALLTRLSPAVVLATAALALPAAASATVPVCPDQYVQVVTGQAVQLSPACNPSGTFAPKTYPTHGVIDNSGAYTPTTGYCGPDLAQYTNTNSDGIGTGSIHINVLALNGQPCGATPGGHAPVCTGFSMNAIQGAASPFPNINPCSDPDGNSDIVGGGVFARPAHGLVSFASVPPSYQSDVAFSGTDTCQVVAVDAAGSISLPQTATVNVLPAASGTVVAANGTYSATLPSTSSTISITSPNGGVVAVEPATAPPPVPAGYTLFGQQFDIVAPAATWDQPLRITFDMPAGVDASTVTIIHAGVAVDQPCAGTTQAVPDGCYILDTTRNEITILTSHASPFGIALSPVTTTFLQPIDGSALNIAKLGRVVPVKVTLSLNRRPVTSGPVTLSSVVGRSCTTSSYDTVETYAAAGDSNTATAFRFDSGSGTWIYNLATGSFTADGCYRGYVAFEGAPVAHFDLKVTR